jgi:hypothetical protein
MTALLHAAEPAVEVVDAESESEPVAEGGQ